jgi:hypothetical protein
MEETSGIGITFMPIPITGTIGCGVPVLPGMPEADAPLEDRTELCAVDANWLIGAVPTCDHHARVVCELTEIDWPGVVAEAGREMDSADRPWADRERHSQAEARDHLAHFTKACA